MGCVVRVAESDYKVGDKLDHDEVGEFNSKCKKGVSHCLLPECYVEETIYIAPVNYPVHSQSDCIEVEDEQLN